jgi:hypothetical protein
MPLARCLFLDIHKVRPVKSRGRGATNHRRSLFSAETPYWPAMGGMIYDDD